MAEALLRHALAAESPPLCGLEVTSGGLAAAPGMPISENTVRSLQKTGLDISSHQSRPVTQELVNRSLLILCMTTSHEQLLRTHFQVDATNVCKMMDMVPDGDLSRIDIPDPVGGDLSAYETVRDCMVEAIPHVVQYLKNDSTPNQQS